MRMFFSEIDIEIEFNDTAPLYLVIESPAALRKVLNSMWIQYNGEEGSVIASEEGKEISFAKAIELIMNPFDIDLNNKKLNNSLLSEFNRLAREDHTKATEQINYQIVNYLDLIARDIPYRINYELDLDPIALAKSYKMRFDEEEKYQHRLISYIKLLHRTCNISCFVLCNIRPLMSIDELKSLYRDLLYEHINIIDIEGYYSYKLDHESCLIIDKDECLIRLD